MLETVDSENRAHFCTIFEYYLENSCFACVKETSSWDVFSMHTKFLFDRKQNFYFFFFWGGGGDDIYPYV